jgi:hypothetical protein
MQPFPKVFIALMNGKYMTAVVFVLLLFGFSVNAQAAQNLVLKRLMVL